MVQEPKEIQNQTENNQAIAKKEKEKQKQDDSLEEVSSQKESNLP